MLPYRQFLAEKRRGIDTCHSSTTLTRYGTTLAFLPFSKVTSRTEGHWLVGRII